MRLAAVTMALLAAAALAEIGGATPGGAAEARLFAAHPEVAAREGHVLRLWPGRLEVELRDRPCSHEETDCEMYHLDAVFADGRIAGVETTRYEGAGYLLVAGDQQIDVGERPVASPDGRHMLAAHWSDAAHDPALGISLLAVDEHGMRLVRRVMPDVLAAYEQVRWISPKCVAFTASTFSAPGLYGNGERSDWYLVDEVPEWRLTRTPTDACRG
jgi:hypothetical protein